MTLEARLCQGAAQLGIALTVAQAGLLLQLQQELLHWNRRVNLTAIRDPEESLEKHLLDSITPARWLPQGARILDMGSGAGFPGLPLLIVRPDLRLTSVDSVGKKMQFQRHAVRTLGLHGVELVTARLESLVDAPTHVAGYDVIVSRAFGSLPLLADYALPLLRPDGFVLALKGRDGAQELREAAEGLTQRGLEGEVVARLRLPWSGGERVLVRLVRLKR